MLKETYIRKLVIIFFNQACKIMKAHIELISYYCCDFPRIYEGFKWSKNQYFKLFQGQVIVFF